MTDGGATPKGGFFAVDNRMWAKVCSLGMNEAVAYNVLARGTGRDNRTTAWSVEAVERYTGVSRRKAKSAVERLLDEQCIRLLRGGTKPQYDLIPFGEMPGADPRPTLTFSEKAVLDRVKSFALLSRSEMKHARSAAAKGWLLEHEGEFGPIPAPEIKPELIWLPNELISGAVGEIPPLELVRQTQDAMTLRLAVDLYYAQNLREDGGISREIIWQKYDRFEVGKQAQFTVWGFRSTGQWVSWGNQLTDPHRRENLTEEEKESGKNPAVDFFRRMEQLRDLRLLEWAPHLVESSQKSGEIIHPVGLGGSDSIEDRLGRAAKEAGRALVTERQYDWAMSEGMRIIAPVLRHIAQVELIGIARLRYRPHTKLTGAWRAELNDQAQKHLARYEEIARKRCARSSRLRHQSSIKDGSKKASREVSRGVQRRY